MNWIKTHPNFLSRVLCLVVILIALVVYQNMASGWAELQEENEAVIAEVEAYNAEVLAAQEAEDSAVKWADGTYTGSGTGFGGEIEVSVAIENDVITDITILSADGEDDSYLTAALDIIDEILDAQSVDVDTITGATFSSTGILTAVTEALSEAEALAAEQNAEAAESSNASIWIDGTYTGSGTGFGGEIEVSVTIENDVITDITILSANGEDDSYLTAALDIIDEILDAQSTEVNAITGATFSSTGIKTAAEDALSQAVNTNG